MDALEKKFNQSGLSRFLNSKGGRVFRLLAGTMFLVVGFLYRHETLGMVLMAWGIFPFTAGAFDICYISAALGGPLSGSRIRHQYGSGGQAVGAS